VNADLLFVGYGIDAPEQKWNDYKGPAEDYRGKILVMLVNDPPATAANLTSSVAAGSPTTVVGLINSKKRPGVGPSAPCCCIQMNPPDTLERGPHFQWFVAI